MKNKAVQRSTLPPQPKTPPHSYEPGTPPKPDLPPQKPGPAVPPCKGDGLYQ